MANEDFEYRRTGMLEDEFYEDDDFESNDPAEGEGDDGRSIIDDDNVEDTDDDSQDGADEGLNLETSKDDTDDEDDGDDDDGDDGDDDGDVDPITQRFTQLGLDKKYTDPLAALESIRHADAAITQARQDNSELTRLLVESRKSVPTEEQVKERLPEISDEDFFEDPIGSLKKLGVLGPKENVNVKEEVQNAVNDAIALDRIQRNYETFVSNTQDFGAMMPVMEQIYKENPSMRYLPLDEGAKVLYELAKARSGQTTRKVVAKKTGGDKLTEQKQRANTSSTRNGSTKRRNAPKTEGDLRKMSEAELEAYLGYQADD